MPICASQTKFNGRFSLENLLIMLKTEEFMKNGTYVKVIAHCAQFVFLSIFNSHYQFITIGLKFSILKNMRIFFSEFTFPSKTKMLTNDSIVILDTNPSFTFYFSLL